MLHLIRHHRARMEAIALAIFGVVLSHLALVYELHEKLDHLAHEGGGYGVDQLFIAIIIVGILGFVFGVLRFGSCSENLKPLHHLIRLGARRKPCNRHMSKPCSGITSTIERRSGRWDENSAYG